MELLAGVAMLIIGTLLVLFRWSELCQVGDTAASGAYMRQTHFFKDGQLHMHLAQNIAENELVYSPRPTTPGDAVALRLGGRSLPPRLSSGLFFPLKA